MGRDWSEEGSLMLGSELMKILGGGSAAGSGSAIILDSDTIRTNDLGPWKIDNDGFTYQWVPVFAQYILKATWIAPQSGMNLFDVRATLLSGQVPTVGTLNTWQNLGTDREWGWSDENGHNSQLKIEIRLSSTQSVVHTAIITFIP